jgi:DNA-binding PadR family transcriptional regulator
MLSARSAILQTLRRGPAYGQVLMRRVAAATERRVSLAPGSLYPALKTLEKARLVRSWSVVPGRKRGSRRRTYYELTVRGVREAESEAKALHALVGSKQPSKMPRRAERAAILARLERVDELFEFATQMRQALLRPRSGA